ncbi:MAG: tetratricopeptide repeat protein [Acidobacteriota bacterium]
MKRKSFSFGFITFLTFLLLLASPLGAQTKKEREQAKRLQDQADKAYNQKNYRLAADTYGQSIAVVANNSYAHFHKGFAHFNLKENDQAISEFSTALSQGYKPLDVYRVRFYIYYEQKNYDAALDDIRKGLALDPKDPAFLKALGEINLANKAYPEALDSLQRASQVALNDADIYYDLAQVHLAMGDTKGQLAAAQAALEKGTRFPGECHYLVGDAQQKLLNGPASIDAYLKALNSKPDLYQAYRNLAEVYRSESRYNDAINIAKEGLKKFPMNGNIYTDLSWYYSLADRPEDAVQAGKAGVTLLPDQYLAYTNLCRAYNDLKNYSDAASACNSALKIEPDDGETNYYLGNAYVGLGRSAEATSKYAKAVTGLTDYTAKHPTFSDGWYLLGNASFANKEYDNAINAYQKSLAISPKFLKARVNLGIVYTRKKNKTAALEQYNLLLPADANLAARLKTEIDRM